jgi:hypothetical protein
MRRALPLLLLFPVTMGGCSSPGGPYPSLQPRAAENIDPRVPVEKPMNDRPVTPALSAQLRQLVSEAQTGEAAFEPAAVQAERLASSAGAPQSEGWIAAQEALSAAIAARSPTTKALGDIDTLSSTLISTNGGIAPKDLAAIKSAAAEVAAIDERQRERINALKARLGI